MDLNKFGDDKTSKKHESRVRIVLITYYEFKVTKGEIGQDLLGFLLDSWKVDGIR